MSEVITKLVIDCATGEAVSVPLTEEELAQRELDAANALAEQEAREAEEAAKAALKESARTKLIAGEPLTAEEASTLIP